MRIVVFDFDGTITKKDTLLEFISYTCGKSRLYRGLFLYSPLLIAFKLKLYPNWKAKEKVFSYFFKNISVSEFDKWGKGFAALIDKLVYPDAMKQIQAHLKEGDTVVIISASMENWIRPWASANHISHVLATKLEIDQNGLLTGKFSSPNCYGKEKVNRLLAVFPDRSQYELWVYGDSRGDKELIDFADKGWYNKFR